MSPIIVGHLMNMGMTCISRIRMNLIMKKYGDKPIMYIAHTMTEAHNADINLRLFRLMKESQFYETNGNRYQLSHLKDTGFFIYYRARAYDLYSYSNPYYNIFSERFDYIKSMRDELLLMVLLTTQRKNKECYNKYIENFK